MIQRSVPASGSIIDTVDVIPGRSYRVTFDVSDAAGGALNVYHHEALEEGSVDVAAHDVASGEIITGTETSGWSGEWTLIAVAPQVQMVCTAAEGADVIMQLTPLL